MRLKRRPVEAYLRMIAAGLALTHWRIVYDPNTAPDEDAVAEIETTDGLLATVYLSPHFRKLPRADQRETLVHEVCHLHTDRVRVGVFSLAGGLSKRSYAIAENMLLEAEEHAVQAFARILAPRFPLPKF